MLETNTLSELHLFYPLLFVLVIIVTFVLARVYKDKLDDKKDMHAKDCDTDVMQDLIQQMSVKYPDVNQNFIIKPEKEQNIENNQEIHDINKKLLEFEDIIKDLKNAHRN